MSRPIRLLAIYAHPDDESFGVAGTFANVTDSGGSVTLVCATRGEVGEISDPSLATPETLAQVREQELRTAMEFVSVSDVRFLGYRDSGMDGTPENDDPRAFKNADHDAVVASLLEILSEVKPDVVLTFGPDGVYGHPDHIKAGEVATAAVERFADENPDAPILYYNAVPRERILANAKRSNGPFAAMTPEQLASFGTPADQITTVLDVSAQIERNLSAIRAHRTQVGPNGPFADLDPQQVREFMQTERFRIAFRPFSRMAWDPLIELSDSMLFR